MPPTKSIETTQNKKGDQLSASQSIPSDLPTWIRGKDGSLLRPRDNISAFLAVDLDVGRLDEMVKHGLWLAGPLGHIRPLHRQKIFGRRCVIAEDLDLHLLWRGDILFVKPLPAYLLDEAFVQTYIVPDLKLSEAANGFLLSYASLITHRSDFDIARREGLIPSTIDWSDWQVLFDSKLDAMLERFQAGLLPCSLRFSFGELRLTRVEYIYCFHPVYKFKNLIRGYCTMPATYQSFLRRNFAWLFAVFAYLTVILTAMQVGLGTHGLQDSADFNRACYGFTVFSIVLPAVILVVGAVVSLMLTFYHVGVTRKLVKNAGIR